MKMTILGVISQRTRLTKFAGKVIPSGIKANLRRLLISSETFDSVEQMDDSMLDMLITHCGHRLDKANKGEWNREKYDNESQFGKELESALDACRSRNISGDHIAWAEDVLKKFRAREKDQELAFDQGKIDDLEGPIGVLDAIRSRRSIRYFQHREIEINKIEQVLDAGRWAPCSANRQAWRFVAQKVGKGEGKTKGSDVLDYQPLPFGAAVIYVAIDERPYHRELDAGWKFAAAMDAAAATQNMLLQAHALGLGTCWYYGAERLNQQKLRARLNLPESCYIYATVQIGYPAEAPHAPGRRPLRAVSNLVGFDSVEKAYSENPVLSKTQVEKTLK